MNFLKIDSPIIRFMETIADLMLLNVLFLLSILPIFTIGASCTAMASVANDVISGEKKPVFRHFIKIFKRNFFKGTILTLVGLVILFTFRMWFLFSNQWFTNGSVALLVKIILSCSLIVFLAVALWIFNVMGRFQYSIIQSVSLALVLCLRHFFTTIMMLLIVLASILLTLQFGVKLIFLWLILGFSLVTLGIGGIAYPVLIQYSKEESLEEPKTL